MSAWTYRHSDGKAVHKIVPPRTRIPCWKGLSADSEEKHEPVSDIDTAAADSLKVLDPKRPIREADIDWRSPNVRFVPIADIPAASPRAVKYVADPQFKAWYPSQIAAGIMPVGRVQRTIGIGRRSGD